MKKIGFPVKMFFLVSVFSVYGIFKISNAIATLSHDAHHSKKQQEPELKSKRYTAVNTVNALKVSITLIALCWSGAAGVRSDLHEKDFLFLSGNDFINCTTDSKTNSN